MTNVKGGAAEPSPPNHAETVEGAAVDSADEEDEDSDENRYARQAQRLELGREERRFLERNLAPWLTSSPRRLKRLVNVYRIIKASLPGTAAATFTTKGYHREVLVLLTLVTMAPHAAPIVFDLMDRLSEKAPLSEFETSLSRTWTLPMPERATALGALGLLARQDDEIDVDRLKGWTDVCARYSFLGRHAEQFIAPVTQGTVETTEDLGTGEGSSGYS
jgi:hypothetical protein